MKKVIVLGLTLLSALNSCGGDQELDEAATQDSVNVAPVMHKGHVHMQPTPLPNGEQYNIEYTQYGIDSILKGPVGERPTTPEAAASYHLAMPPKLTVPPHALPAKDIKLVEKTDSTAIFSFGSQNPQIDARLLLYKTGNATDSVWLVRTVTVMHNIQ